MNKMVNVFVVIIVTTLFIASCDSKGPEPTNPPSGTINFEFKHKIDGSNINYDTIKYINEAGNQYMVSEIQYFISDVKLHNTTGETVNLNSWEDIFYVDTDIAQSLTYTFNDKVTIGTYNKISFTFGINEEKNNSLMFVNPPESFMFWPENLGGGYHYLKLNGKWLNEDQLVSPYNFHLGIGQIYQSYPDSIIGFVQNYFRIEMEGSTFEVVDNEVCKLEIIMNVENWFKSPNTYDHNQWGGDIMQNQEAMNQAAENGNDVFTYNIN